MFVGAILISRGGGYGGSCAIAEDYDESGLKTIFLKESLPRKYDWCDDWRERCLREMPADNIEIPDDHEEL